MSPFLEGIAKRLAPLKPAAIPARLAEAVVQAPPEIRPAGPSEAANPVAVDFWRLHTHAVFADAAVRHLSQARMV